MKKSVLFVLFALISVAGFSQITGWNAKVGMNFSNYTGDLDLNAKVGFKLGGVVQVVSVFFQMPSCLGDFFHRKAEQFGVVGFKFDLPAGRKNLFVTA